MKRQIYVEYNGSTDTVIKTVDLPNKCPHCGETMGPEPWSAATNSTYDERIERFGVLTQCTLCFRYYALEFVDASQGFGVEYALVPYTYNPLPQVFFSPVIQSLSPDFVEIYKQALSAELSGLDRIAGVSYRRAVEFLIKDFCICKHPEKADDIKSKFLGEVINTYLKAFPKILSLTTACTWIGNDETHYVRRHLDRDINDLKQFIESTQLLISAELSADDALEFTSKK